VGGKVGRLDVGKIGRFEGGKARKNLMEAYTFHNSFLIPSTQKFLIGDLRSPIFHKIYSPGKIRKWHSLGLRSVEFYHILKKFFVRFLCTVWN